MSGRVEATVQADDTRLQLARRLVFTAMPLVDRLSAAMEGQPQQLVRCRLEHITELTLPRLQRYAPRPQQSAGLHQRTASKS